VKSTPPKNPDEPYRDPVVDAFKAGVDVTLLDRNLRLTPTQRLEQLQTFVAFLVDAGRAGRRA
jgi:hypothetical protein